MGGSGQGGAHGSENPYVSRGGLKLRHALEVFGVDPAGWWCADLGCSTGGFTDCLLQAGAARVYAVDTAYGELAWRLRQDERVAVMERTNALHAEVPADVAERGGVDLVVIDLGWTVQSRAIPAALRWVVPGRGPGARAGVAGDRGGEDEAQVGGGASRLAPGARSEQETGAARRIITLVKPHYEVEKGELGAGGVLDAGRAEEVAGTVRDSMGAMGVRVAGFVESPILGGKKGKGNREWLVMVEAG